MELSLLVISIRKSAENPGPLSERHSDPVFLDRFLQYHSLIYSWVRLSEYLPSCQGLSSAASPAHVLAGSLYQRLKQIRLHAFK